jgi:glutamyl-tRNA(Gln) amidotransferase subunit D
MAKPGDRVKVETKDGVYEGVLMPRPEKVPGDSMIIKLKSGYNIGVSRKKITSIKVLEEHKKGEIKLKKAEKKKGLPEVAILSTGGTISSKVDYVTGGVFPALSASDLAQNVPEMNDIANFDFKQVAQILSEDMTVEIWQKLAKEIYSEIKKGKRGIIVTHGTDTMAFTSAAISFMVQNSPVPIIFVGAQRSVDRGSSDAFPNLLTAAIAAAQWDGAETVICMHESMNDNVSALIRGTKARKMHTERRDAFKPVNDVPLARVDYKCNIFRTSNYRLMNKDNVPILNLKMDKKVALVYTYPGIDPKIIDYYCEKKYHGIVIAGTGLGHVPHNLLPSLKKCYRAGIPVIMTSQCLFGRVNQHVYETARVITGEGKVIYGQDMTPETALIKLMFVLGQTKKYDRVKELMQKNLVGEITERTAPLAFI